MPRERVIVFAIFALLAFMAWIGGCAFTPVEKVLGWAGLVLFLLTVCLPFDRESGLKWPIVKVTKDPVFTLGFLFIVFLVIQWQNSGREFVIDEATLMWKYGSPPVEWLPSSIMKSDSVLMLHWFVPAVAVILAIRNRLITRASKILLSRLVCLNAGLLALFGMVQMMLGMKLGYGLDALSDNAPYFASFGYANHAGTYFILVFAFSAALLLGSLFKYRSGWTVWKGVLGVVALLCLAAAGLSLSHAALFLSFFVGGIVVAISLLLSVKYFGPVARLNVLLSVIALACLAFFLVSGFGKARADRLGHEAIFNKIDVVDKIQSRQYMVRAAAGIWKDAPWFGVGGWGYRHLIGCYVEPGERRIGIGTANAHCDPMQFLAEFGVVGFGLLVGCIGIMLFGSVKSGGWRQPIVYISLAGLAATCVHSLVDLPFRNPAILCTWVGILGIISRSSEKSGTNNKNS